MAHVEFCGGLSLELRGGLQWNDRLSFRFFSAETQAQPPFTGLADGGAAGVATPRGADGLASGAASGSLLDTRSTGSTSGGGGGTASGGHNTQVSPGPSTGTTRGRWTGESSGGHTGGAS
jgi:hypothetical protein